MDAEFIVWLAGFVDGEGCIGMHIPPNCNNPTVTLQIVNTNKDVLDYICMKVGEGSVCSRKRPTSKHKDSWRYQLYSDRAVFLCRRMLPYLKLKRMQAELVIEYWDRFKEECSGYNLRTRPTVIGAQEYVSRIHELNRKGSDN